MNCSLKSQQLYPKGAAEWLWEQTTGFQVFSCYGDEMFAALKASAVILTCERGIAIERTAGLWLVAKSSLSWACWGIRSLDLVIRVVWVTELAQGWVTCWWGKEESYSRISVFYDDVLWIPSKNAFQLTAAPFGSSADWTSYLLLAFLIVLWFLTLVVSVEIWILWC